MTTMDALPAADCRADDDDDESVLDWRIHVEENRMYDTTQSLTTTLKTVLKK